MVSGNQFNELAIRHAVVVPLTPRERGFPHHIPVADDGGLTRPSWAMCEAVRAVSTQRLGHRIGMASAETVAKTVDQLTLWLAAAD